MPKRSAMRPIRMPPTAEPNQASELASAGTERAPPISSAIGLSATEVIQGAPNDRPSRTSEIPATTQEARVSIERVSELCVVNPIPGRARRAIWRGRAKLVLCSEAVGGLEMRKPLIAVALAAMAAFAGDTAAQSFPSRPITIIVPFAAGGPSDVLARVIGERMRVTLGQTVIVENVTGAGGTIGVTRAARAPADGYTLSFGHLGTHVVNGAIYPLTFDLVNDLDPVGLVGANPMLVVSKNARAGEEPQGTDRLDEGEPGQGDVRHRRRRLRRAFQRRVFPEPDRHQGALRALSRHRPGACRTSSPARSTSSSTRRRTRCRRCRAARSRPMRVTDGKRLPSAPDIPTVEEAGLPGFHVSLWSGLWAPKGTPKDVDRQAQRGGA